jgi:hypothetical protein
MAILLKVLAFFGSTTGMIVGGVLAVLASYGWTYHKGKSDGYSACKLEWNAAELTAIENARRARIDAERSSGVSDDRDRRD